MGQEQDFLEELSIFRNEVNSALKFLYTELAIHSIASKNKKVLRALNLSPTFWNTVLNALQHSTFITLGRIFDADPQDHTVNRLFRVVENNKDLFSRKSFIERWNKNLDRSNINKDNWLNEYIKDLYIPSDVDFRKLRKFIAKQRKTYEDIYRPIRHHFGHKKYTKNEDVKVLFDKVQVRELEKYCVSLSGIHEALWQLFHNGRGPLMPIKQGRYSTQNILKKSYRKYGARPANVQFVEEVKVALNLLMIGNENKK